MLGKYHKLLHVGGGHKLRWLLIYSSYKYMNFSFQSFFELPIKTQKHATKLPIFCRK